MLQLKALKTSTSLSDVADLLEMKPAMLSYNIYKKDISTRYKKFEIPKRSGGVRKICAPNEDLMLIQSRLSKLLQNCLQEINESKGISDQNEVRDHIAHGFKRHRSIMTNATQHRSRRYVFNVDIKDFFCSINFGRVRGFFLQDKNFALSPKVATVLAQIACYENQLPQGSPCSPVISNLVGHILDIHLVRLAATTGCTYSRYADDLTFSTNNPDFPKSIALQKEDDTHEWVPGRELERLIRRSGFEVNPSKTRMQYRSSRQEVTGLVVNRKVSTAKEYRHSVRAMVHSLLNIGTFSVGKKAVAVVGAVAVVDAGPSHNQLQGKLAFIEQVDSYDWKIHAKQLPRIGQSRVGRDRLYHDFLMFHLFFAAPSPVILCEGKTDNIYLRHAIRSLANLYPSLATIDPAGQTKLNIRLLDYVDRTTGRILELGGGTGPLAHFISKYHAIIGKKFKAPGCTHPVILLIDNDKGAIPIYAAIEKITKAKPTGTEPYIHVSNNLYVVPTPKHVDGSYSKIEDYFSKETLGTLIGDKHFADGNDVQTSEQFGKVVFALKVVAANAKHIDFNAFKGLLNNVSTVIEEHSKPSSQAKTNKADV